MGSPSVVVLEVIDQITLLMWSLLWYARTHQ